MKLTEDELYMFHERAAIMHYDGHISKHEAEIAALAEVLDYKNRCEEALHNVKNGVTEKNIK